MGRKALFLIILFFFFPVKLSSQWQPDVRLTNDSFDSHVSSSSAWNVASSDPFVHVVWYDTRDGNFEIYYKRSSDRGTSWSIDTRLTVNSNFSWDPCVAVSGQIVHVVWHDGRDGNYEIYYKRSSDGGINWGEDTRLTNDGANSKYSSLTASGQDLGIIWEDNRDGNDEIYYKRSTNDGINWGPDTRLTNNSFFSYWGSLSISGQIVHAVFEDNREGNYEIYYKRSTDRGINWSQDTRLTYYSYPSSIPSISSSGQVVNIVWEDKRSGNWEIYCKRSSDGGVSWGADTRLTPVPIDSYFPSIAASGQAVHIVWTDYRDNNNEIYYKISTDGGNSWGSDIRLTNNFSSQNNASISVSGEAVHVVWQDARNGNWEIYYKLNPNGNPNAIININNEIPKQYFLSQNYPNPFNPNTKIQFALPMSSFATLIVYDALGRNLETLVNEQLNAGTYEADWSADKFSSGVYLYKLSTGDFTQTKKMLLIK